MVQIYQSAGPSSWPKIIERTYYYVACTYEKHQQANNEIRRAFAPKLNIRDYYGSFEGGPRNVQQGTRPSHD